MIKDKDREIMSILQEECAECIQAVSKVFRFGFDNHHPDRSETNREHLAEEIGDLQAMIDLLISSGIVDADSVKSASIGKHKKLQAWSNIYE